MHIIKNLDFKYSYVYYKLKAEIQMFVYAYSVNLFFNNLLYFFDKAINFA